MAGDRGSNGPKGVAPHTTIQTLVIVRPLKVIAVILASLAMLLMLLSVAATTWLEANSVRQGLWERCRYRQNETDEVDCNITLRTETADWIQVCRSLCLLAMIMTFFGIVITSVGLRSSHFRYKTRYYLAGMIVWFLADALQLSSLVTYPIKFLDNITAQAELHWQFGWAYGIGWGAAIFVFVAGLMLLIDKGAEELVYREVTVNNKVLEEDATEIV